LVSGRTDLLIPTVALISSVAAIMDVATGRIYNWLTLPALLAGLFASAWLGGWAGLGDAALGAVAGLVLYGWMFWLRVMGGGDVKLLMALGAWGGFAYVQEVAALGVMLGGALAVVLLAFQGKLVAFLRKMRRFVTSLLIKELELELPKVDRKLTMPFGPPIAVAAIWTAVSHPLLRWGFTPW
jgi:prepilin peptidase CpaA